MADPISPLQPDWTLYRTFLAVLREGSLSGAARQLALTQPTVGRHIEALEAALQIALFSRSPSGLVPTEAALALRQYAEELDATTAALSRAATRLGEGVRGTVRISVSEMIGVEVLPPMLAQLRAQWPELVLEIMLNNRVEDLLRRDADIAVRGVRPQQDALVAQFIGTINIGLHATPDYLARHGAPQSWDELGSHGLIGFDSETPFIREVQSRIGGLRRERMALRADSDVMQLAATRAGFGVGVCQVGLARRYGLVRVMADQFNWPMDTWLAMHGDLRNHRACRVVFDALVTGLRDYANAA